jgi:ABC-type dipeptide/oligopeptide/nickel transport system permease component
MEIDPQTSSTILAILAIVVAVLVVFFMTRHYGDPARQMIEQEAVAARG